MMKLINMRRIHFIINPIAGKKEPILSDISDIFRKTDVKWSVSVTRKTNDGFTLTKKAMRKKYDAIAVYGGDGTVMEVAQALYGCKTPLLILPGGTANVMGKELGLPQDTKEMLELIKGKKYSFRYIDMALFVDKPFLIRINIGIAADMIHSSNRGLKNRWGQFAYALTALRHIVSHDRISYEIDLDGKIVKERGVALVIANSGNVGVTGMSLLPGINIADGLLDIILFKTANLFSLASWVKSALSNKKPTGAIRHWKAKKVQVTVSPEQNIICDDIAVETKIISAQISPRAIRIGFPKISYAKT
jgi:diacylglycerol kinase (ATP)